MKVKENDEDAVALLSLVLNEMEEEDERDKSVWLPSTFVDREVKITPVRKDFCETAAITFYRKTKNDANAKIEGNAGKNEKQHRRYRDELVLWLVASALPPYNG